MCIHEHENIYIHIDTTNQINIYLYKIKSSVTLAFPTYYTQFLDLNKNSKPMKNEWLESERAPNLKRSMIPRSEPPKPNKIYDFKLRDFETEDESMIPCSKATKPEENS